MNVLIFDKNINQTRDILISKPFIKLTENVFQTDINYVIIELQNSIDTIWVDMLQMGYNTQNVPIIVLHEKINEIILQKNYSRLARCRLGNFQKFHLGLNLVNTESDFFYLISTMPTGHNLLSTKTDLE